MSSSPSPPPLTRLRWAAYRNRQWAISHQHAMQALVEATTRDVDDTAIALSVIDPGMPDADVLVLRSSLRRSEEIAAAARELCLEAREHEQAAGELMTEVDTAAAIAGEAHASLGTVLVVDDYEDTRDLLAIVLREAGFAVRTAANGLEALLLAYELQPVVIVMDVAMPVLDGIEATRLIKTLEPLRDARVIAYSAQTALHDPAVKRLFSAILQKPAAPDVVVATVQRFAAAA